MSSRQGRDVIAKRSELMLRIFVVGYDWSMDNEVKSYIDAIADPGRKKDIIELIGIISSIGSETPAMWGTSIISFGLYHYKYESGREGDAPKIGISNRKQAIVVYGLNISDEDTSNSKLLKKLGAFKKGRGCLYISSLGDIDLAIFEQMVQNTRR
jgi:Domain of unknown function (DU1801)